MEQTFAGLPLTKHWYLSNRHLGGDIFCFEGVHWTISLNTQRRVEGNTPKTRHSRPPSQLCLVDYNFQHAQITHALKSRRCRCWVVFSLPVIPLNDGLPDAFVSTSYLPGHGGNNCNVWLRENRANHQWLQDIWQMQWHLVYYPLLSSPLAESVSCTDRPPHLRASSMLIWFILAFHNNWGHGSGRWIRSEHDRMRHSCTVCPTPPTQTHTHTHSHTRTHMPTPSLDVLFS